MRRFHGIFRWSFLILMLGATSVAAQEPPPGQGNKPDEVTVGVYVNDVQQLDLQSHSYAMDFYLWMRWSDPTINPSLTLEYMNAFELWGHVAKPLYPAPVVLPDGQFYMVVRHQGRFSAKLPLERYPFDTQNLVVQFEDSAHGASRQVYVADDPPIMMNPDLTLPGYVPGQPSLSIAAKPYVTNFGDTALTAQEPYSRVTFIVPVKRPTLTYAVKIVLPIFLVVMCGVLVYLMHPSFVEGRIGMGISALLTLVVLHMTTSAQLAEVDYLMMIDVLYYLSYAYVVATLAEVVWSTWAVEAGTIEEAFHHDRRMAIIVTGSYFVASAGVILYALI
jgi:hypothetical protein